VVPGGCERHPPRNREYFYEEPRAFADRDPSQNSYLFERIARTLRADRFPCQVVSQTKPRRCWTSTRSCSQNRNSRLIFRVRIPVPEKRTESRHENGWRP